MSARFPKSWFSRRRLAFAGWAVLALFCVGTGTAGLYHAIPLGQGGSFGGLFGLQGPESPLLRWIYRICDYYLLTGYTVGSDLGLYGSEGTFPWIFSSWAGGCVLLLGGWAAHKRARSRYSSPDDLGAFAGATGLTSLVLLSGLWGFQFWVSSMSPDIRLADRALASRYNQTGFDVLRELVARPDSAGARQEPLPNEFLSPISLGNALHMITEGARGPTAAELQEALHLPQKPSGPVASGPSRILQRLRYPEPEYVLQRLIGRATPLDTRLANAGWFDSSPTKAMKSAGLLDLDFEIREEYRRVLEEDFDAEVHLRDFGSGGIPQEVNRWASEKTEGKIRKMLDKAPRRGAVLANAAYFFGGWSAPFDPENTEPRPFVVPTETGKPDTVQVPTMSREAKYPFMEQEVEGSERPLQGVRLPYGETGRLAMYVFVPPDLEQFVRRLGPERWAGLTGKVDSTATGFVLQLPKFTLRKRIDLVPVLRELGVEKAFVPAANFRGILSVTSSSRTDSLPQGQPGPLFLSQVRQKVYLKVNEKGTEAAAVTFGAAAVSVPPTVKVNRPFYFAITERETGAILFHGAIRNPRAGG